MTSKTLLRLHFLAREKANDGKLVSLTNGFYDTGSWRVARTVAARAFGAELHLHKRQTTRSWIAGRVTGWHPSPTETDRVIFSFRRDDHFCREQPDGWGRGAEKRYVWNE